ncbi:MAG: glycosyltransferase [Sphingomonadaceae bacterium]|nr:glycosyltransferase [Sphingomonadaceae bacterium]
MIVLSHLRWDFVFQRPQHLLSRAAADFDVVFLEEPIHADETVPRLEIAERAGGIRVAQPMLPQGMDEAGAVAAQRAIIDELAARAGGPLVLWYYTPMALAFSRHLEADLVIFDKMDELSAFRNAPPLLLELEEELLARADIVFTGGASMHRAAAHRHANIHCFPSSIDAPHFGVARRGAADPADQGSAGRPRLGYFGVIDERMDLALVAQVADLRPDWQLMMIGPVVKIDPASLPQRANIHWLGGRTYDELPAYLANWDIGFMPFALNESTKFISPTKTPEFLAAGLPVVSTAITDVVTPYGDEGLVEIAASAEAVVAAVERLLSADRAPWLARVDARLARGSWDQTWAAMRSQIAKKASEGWRRHPGQALHPRR